MMLYMNIRVTKQAEWRGLCIPFVLFPAPTQNCKVNVHSFVDCSVTLTGITHIKLNWAAPNTFQWSHPLCLSLGWLMGSPNFTEHLFSLNLMCYSVVKVQLPELLVCCRLYDGEAGYSRQRVLFFLLLHLHWTKNKNNFFWNAEIFRLKPKAAGLKAK